MPKKKATSIENVLKKLRNSVSNYNDTEEASTDKHDIWSLKKILVLHDYIKPFLEILRSHNYKKIHYYDPFAGTGFLRIKGKIMPGTPLVPLIQSKELAKIDKNLIFDSVNYSDMKKESITLLEKRANELKSNLPTIINAKQMLFKTIALTEFKEVPPLPQKHYDNAYLVVLDPYGFDVEWQYIERILKNGAVDVILTFPSELANWTKTMKNSQTKLSKMFGGDEYQDFETADEFVKNYCEKIENIPVSWSMKTRSITVDAGQQTYHLICISRSNGALNVFSGMQEKFDSITMDQLDGMYNSAIGNTLERFFN